MSTMFAGQGWLQLGELGLAFALSSLVGLERQLRGKSAGIRTQAIVGTASALFFLVSKYGFTDVLSDHVVLDPSRVAAQIVSGIGFLGAGIILTRRGAVRGLTTAASVWETAAIGMASAAGLWLLAIVVTVLHFVVAYGYAALIRRLPGAREAQVQVEVVYLDGRGLLREVLRGITASGWSVSRADPRSDTEAGTASLLLDLVGPPDPSPLLAGLTGIGGVRSVELLAETDLE